MTEKRMHVQEMFDDLEKLLCKDIKAVIAKGDISPTDYNSLHTAVKIYGEAIDIEKDLATIEAMEVYGKGDDYIEGYASGAMRSSHNTMPYYDHSWDSPTGNSYARGRSSMTGRYVSRDDEIGAKLNHMMQTASSDAERAAISRVMNEMGR